MLQLENGTTILTEAGEEILLEHEYFASGGAAVGGDVLPTLTFALSGGVALGGDVLPTLTFAPSGGVALGGSSSEVLFGLAFLINYKVGSVIRVNGVAQRIAWIFGEISTDGRGVIYVTRSGQSVYEDEITFPQPTPQIVYVRHKPGVRLYDIEFDEEFVLKAVRIFVGRGRNSPAYIYVDTFNALHNGHSVIRRTVR